MYNSSHLSFRRAFQLAELLIVTWCSLIVARSETVETEQEALLRRAAEQLERLAVFRRYPENQEKIDLSKFTEELENPISRSLLDIWKTPMSQNHLDETRGEVEQDTPLEELELLPEETQSDITKQIGDEKLTIGVITDPRYAAMMQERIKRGYNPGSASLLTGIAGGLISGIASASSASAAKAIAGSSETAYKPVYAEPPVHTVEHTYSVINILLCVYI